MSAMQQDEEVQQVSSGASETYPMQCGNLRKGGHIMLKGKPCKVVEIKVSKVGKHGHAKAHIVGMDIFTDKKYEEICPSSHNITIPIVTRKEYQITNIDGNYLQLLTDKGEIVDVLYEEKMCNHSRPIAEIEKLMDDGTYNATVLSAVGEEIIKEVKKAQN